MDQEGRKEAVLKTADASVQLEHPSVHFRRIWFQVLPQPESPECGCHQGHSRGAGECDAGHKEVGKDGLPLAISEALRPPADPMKHLPAQWCKLGHLRAPPATLPGCTRTTVLGHLLQS